MSSPRQAGTPTGTAWPRGWGCIALALALWLLPACSSEPLAGRTAGVVFLTKADCEAFVVQSLTGTYALLSVASANLVATRGDVFEGGVLRPGRVTFRYLPVDTVQDRREARQVILNVDATGLSVTAAQAALQTACPGSG
ncbi:MAG: hypothetical protein AAFV01_03060 [Bacteroidota bacterium]